MTAADDDAPTTDPGREPHAGGDAHAAMSERVAQVLELIRPAIQMDGGDLELVEVADDGEVRIRLHGACIGCPSSSITLHAGIERQLRDHVPGFSRVIAVED